MTSTPRDRSLPQAPLTLWLALPLALMACGASSDVYLRREVVPLAQPVLQCPAEQIATRCSDANCYRATARGCGQAAEFVYGDNGWVQAGGLPPAQGSAGATVEVTGHFVRSDGLPASGIEILALECDERGASLGTTATVVSDAWGNKRMDMDTLGSAVTDVNGVVQMSMNPAKLTRSQPRFTVFARYSDPRATNIERFPQLRAERPIRGIPLDGRAAIDLNQYYGWIEISGLVPDALAPPRLPEAAAPAVPTGREATLAISRVERSGQETLLIGTLAASAPGPLRLPLAQVWAQPSTGGGPETRVELTSVGIPNGKTCMVFSKSIIVGPSGGLTAGAVTLAKTGGEYFLEASRNPSEVCVGVERGLVDARVVRFGSGRAVSAASPTGSPRKVPAKPRQGGWVQWKVNCPDAQKTCSSDQSTAESCFFLGICHQSGALPKDPEKARAAHEKSCGLGDSRACHHLAVCYTEGTCGWVKDNRLASEMYGKACKAGEAADCNR